MPRPNRPRSIASEENVARRIAYEREQRGWSYAGLASRMTKVGCAIDQSALYKVENSTPRRRISVDELVALSTVLDIPVDELLVPPEIATDKRALELLENYHKARDAADEVFFDLAEHAVAHPRVEGVLRQHMTAEDKKTGFDAAVRRFRRNAKAKEARDGK